MTITGKYVSDLIKNTVNTSGFMFQPRFHAICHLSVYLIQDNLLSITGKFL